MLKVAVIGSGNLAWHLVPKLLAIGLEVEVISRNKPQAEEINHWLPALITTWKAWSERPKLAAYAAVFLAVPDAAITKSAQQLQRFLPASCPIVHTSGATSVQAIDAYFQQRGVLWPIRSLKKGTEVAAWNDLPLVYFSEQDALKSTLASWAKQLSQITYCLNNEQRAQLHLAAVFSNNFTNYLCQIAYAICEKEGLAFAALLPIIRHSFQTLEDQPPILRQTGAAARGDSSSMQKHLQLLEGKAEWQALYRHISKLIIEDIKHTKA